MKLKDSAWNIDLCRQTKELFSLLELIWQSCPYLLCLLLKDYQRGFALLEAACQTSTIAGDVQLERHLAQLRIRTGDNRSAISHFERARTRDPYILDGMDV